MTDNTREKQHLRVQEDILKDIEETNTVAGIVKKESLDLITNLTNGKDFFIDDESKVSINNIHNRLSVGPNLLGDANAKYAALVARQAAIKGMLPLVPPPTPAQSNLRTSQYWAENAEIEAKLKDLNVIRGAAGVWWVKFLDRRTEYLSLSTHANYFNTASKIHNVNLDITIPAGPARAWITDINQSLDHAAAPNFLWFKTAPGNPNAEYKLCDEKGVPLPEPTPGEYTVQINGQTVTLLWISFAGRSLDLTNLKITPSNADISEVLKLSINAIYKDIPKAGANLVCNKKFELNLRRWPVATPVDTAGLRETEIDNLNVTAPGNIVHNEITHQYTNTFAWLQKEAVLEALKHLDGVRFAQLEEYGKKNGKEEEIKEELYQQINRNFLSTWLMAANLTNINDYGNFRTWFADDNRTWNADKAIIKSADAYQNYLHNNLYTGVQDYMKSELKDLLSDSHSNNIRLKTELSAFLTSIEGRKNDDEINGAGQTIQQATEGDISANDLMRKRKSKSFLGIKWGREDVSYMRFFGGANHEIKDQTVDIATNTNTKDFKNIEPVKYDLKTDITWKNSISTTITFPKTDKRYPRKEIILTQGEVSTLSKKILNCREIGDFKVRTHIVYNMLVSMIKIAEKKNLSLRYRVPGTANQRELVMDKNDIVLYERDDTWAKRRIDTLFDYDSFVTTNTFHGAWDSRSLQTAIDWLMGHFNYAMNEYHEQYRNTTRSNLLKTSVSANGFWTSPIKTIMNLRTVRKFDFTAKAVSEDGKKNVDISFEKNVITLKMGDIELKGKNLGKMLEYRKNKIRIFDGVERNIIFTFYDELVKKLRENSKINRGNFCVREPLTQNIYTMDEDGKLHIISPEDPGDILHGKNSRIVSKSELDDVDARWWRRGCSEAETKEAFMNPCIMGRMIKEMNKKMLRL